MTHPDLKRVIEEIINGKGAEIEIDTKTMRLKSIGKFREALKEIVSLLERLEGMKGVVPEEKVSTDRMGYISSKDDGFNVCRQQVALGIIKVGERLKKNDFENFLMEQHGKDYVGTDDMMPDAFNDWVENLGADELIEYGNKYTKIILAELEGK